jgi:YesN/AraC family two-component response regulator
MPGMNGVDLIAAARIINPGLKAVLISGYADARKLLLPSNTAAA